MNEEHLFQVSLDREAARVKYVAERLVVRAKEKEIAKAAKVQEESAKQSTMAKLEAELQCMYFDHAVHSALLQFLPCFSLLSVLIHVSIHSFLTLFLTLFCSDSPYNCRNRPNGSF